MTGPRRAKDGPRVRHLRSMAVAPTGSSGVGFIGFRTDRFEEMVELFRDLIGLPVLREAAGATWFRLGVDAALHVYADIDPDATRAAVKAAGLEVLTEIERTETAAWCHFRAPDGTVLEIIGGP